MYIPVVRKSHLIHGLGRINTTTSRPPSFKLCSPNTSNILTTPVQLESPSCCSPFPQYAHEKAEKEKMESRQILYYVTYTIEDISCCERESRSKRGEELEARQIVRPVICPIGNVDSCYPLEGA